VRGLDVPAGYLNALSHSLERLAAEGIHPPATRVYLGRFPLPRTLEPEAIVFGDITAGSALVGTACVLLGHPPPAFALYQVLRGNER
jgi:hypothetical protein